MMIEISRKRKVWIVFWLIFLLVFHNAEIIGEYLRVKKGPVTKVLLGKMEEEDMSYVAVSPREGYQQMYFKVNNEEKMMMLYNAIKDIEIKTVFPRDKFEMDYAKFLDGSVSVNIGYGEKGNVRFYFTEEILRGDWYYYHILSDFDLDVFEEFLRELEG